MRILIAFGVFGLAGGGVAADDWLQFRGNHSNSVSADAKLPVNLSLEAIDWGVPLPGRGLSGPIVVEDHVFVTASSGPRQNKLHTMCFDTHTGKQIWERTSLATGRTICHPSMSVATPTPASNGQLVVSFYSSNDVICHDLDGNLQWYRGLGLEFPNASNSLGMASSPVIVAETVIVQVESDAESFAFGLNLATGETRWKIDRPQRANWTSPIAISGKHPVALLQSSAGLAAVDPMTGESLWNFTDGASTVPSATVVGDLVFLPSNGTTVLRLSADRRSYEVVWQKSNLRPSTPSPVVVEGRIYTINSTALTCADADSGERLWQLRIKGQFSSTPVAANGHLYLFNETGMASVVKLSGEKGQIVSQLDLAKTILCTPAISEGGLFVRSDDMLWKLSK